MDTSNENAAVPAGTVVVGVDGSPGSDRALEWAVDQAVREGRPLTLAHGLDDVVESDADAFLGRARQRVADTAPGLTVHELVSTMSPCDTLLGLSEGAALVVVGSRGRGPVRSTVLGSVGVAVVRHASCPVVVVRPTNQGLVRSGVLVGVDGSDRSTGTAEFGYRQASLRGLPLTILHCFPDSFWVDVPDDEQGIVVAEALSGLAEKFPDVQARTEIVRGRADESLVEASRRMDLLVVGAHHGGLSSTLLRGSVSSSVVERADCPVAVVPLSVEAR